MYGRGDATMMLALLFLILLAILWPVTTSRVLSFAVQLLLCLCIMVVGFLAAVAVL